MGGSISLLYAAQYPVDTKSLFLIDSAGVFKSANTPYLKDPTTLRNMIVSKPGDFDRLMKIATSLPPFIPKELKDAQEKLMISQSANTTKLVEQLIVMSKLFTPDSFAIAARSIDQPVLIAWGDKDQIINVEAAAELKGLLKKCTRADHSQRSWAFTDFRTRATFGETLPRFLRQKRKITTPIKKPVLLLAFLLRQRLRILKF